MGPVLYPEIEQQLLKVQLSNPWGDSEIWVENDKKWRKVLNRLLVDSTTMLVINGGGWICSSCCLVEEGNGYQFRDTARFALKNCVHASPHLQCVLSYFILGGGYTHCPVMDTLKCSGTKDFLGNKGEAYFWAPEDYHNFAKAFLGNRALTNTFLKPEFRWFNC